eukprot:TRINITY_DN20656_c0_g1_i1.p1 TRINITY_DN20656_c0_g1~~TRINITY_DN20656_c0_g1_i1.p1  ORF type:complete len:117 (-),score=15.92 TRINITY_DN20656_c0_g1_i1:68-418(-)
MKNLCGLIFVFYTAAGLTQASSETAHPLRFARSLVSKESILPHTANLWKKGLCDRVARQTAQDMMPECQPVGTKVDCKCDGKSPLIDGKQCALWKCGGVPPSAFNPIGHWQCMGYC